jgi:hypothetical protein
MITRTYTPRMLWSQILVLFILLGMERRRLCYIPIENSNLISISNTFPTSQHNSLIHGIYSEYGGLTMSQCHYVPFQDVILSTLFMRDMTAVVSLWGSATVPR